MRTNRIKAVGEGYYHAISRIVAREMLMDDADEKDRFVALMRRAEEFSAVEVLTFAVLDNHFHILVRVPEREEVGEEVIVRRYEALYGKDRAGMLESRWKLLRASGCTEAVEAEQSALKKRMYDVSEFLKTLKMRYTIMFNARHGRTGTLWEGRFKSVLVEPNSSALHNTAKYIDLNAFRAKIVKEPSQYRWCGYGEACLGVKKAIEGIRHILPPHADGKVMTGIAALREYGSRLGGQTPAEVAFPKRVCRFTNGLALGSEEYVDEVKFRTGLVRESPVFVQLPSGQDKVCALRRPRLVTA